MALEYLSAVVRKMNPVMNEKRERKFGDNNCHYKALLCDDFARRCYDNELNLAIRFAL